MSSPAALPKHLARLCLIVAALGVAHRARADGGAIEPELPPVRKGVIQVVPNLDHHYRNDMVEPGWRMYGSQSYGGYGSQGTIDNGELGGSPGTSLNRQPGHGRCDPWRGGCRPPQPWWTR